MPAIEPGTRLTVIKLSPERAELWRYSASVTKSFPDGVLVEALFNRSDDLPFHGVTFHPGDRFLEMYYTNRRYNIYEVYDRDTRALKCWYCNASREMELAGESLYYVDLALDLLVYPDGSQILLDEDEFAALEITPEEREETLQAMQELQERFRQVGGICLAEARV